MRPARGAALLFPFLLQSQTGLLRIQVVQGEGGVHAAGSLTARPLAVQITGESGEPVRGAAVSFHLPEEGASGLFANGLKTDIAITDGQGRAAPRGIQWSRVAGPLEIQVIAIKEQSRAGIVTRQYIAGASTLQQAHARMNATHARKWLWFALAAGGAIGAGLAAGARGGQSSGAAPAPVTIGPPVITIGRP